MDKKTMLIRSKISFFAIVIILIFPMLTLAYDLEEYYPLKEGNSWTYVIAEDKDYYRETYKIEGKESVEDTETIKINVEDRMVYIAIDSQGAKKYKDFYQNENEYEIYNPPVLLFPNNTEIGESKSFSSNSKLYNIDGIKREEASAEGNVVLESMEDVDVPAGKFKNCLKFSSVITWVENDGSHKEDCTISLAPGIGKVEEFCISTEYDKENKIINKNSEMDQLISAVIDGKEIGVP